MILFLGSAAIFLIGGAFLRAAITDWLIKHKWVEKDDSTD